MAHDCLSKTWILVLAPVLLILVSCDFELCSPRETCYRRSDVTISNKTDEELVVRIADADGSFPGERVQAGDDQKVKLVLFDSRGDERLNDKDDKVSIQVFDARSCPVLSFQRSLREIQDNDSTIVITPSDIVPKAQRTNCAI